MRALVAVLLGAVLLTGCDFDVYKMPLPGGTDTGEDPITVEVVFTDVLDLVPQTNVKVNDVDVGKVTDIDLEDYTAHVTLEVRGSVDLPANATAKIRQTSLLGEKFVSLEPPAEGASSEPLQDGDTIPLERTGRNPEVEEVLGALSLVLNGGGVAQLKTIATELNKALEGREDAAKSVLTQVDSLMGELDENKTDIVNAIESLDRLAVTARDQIDSIDAALEELPSALDSIDRQREDLVRMLQALDELGDVGVRVIKESKDATIETFRQLRPVLTQLADSGDDLVNAFHVFLTYPFVDEAVGRDPQVARNLHMGDYVNLSVNMDLNLTRIPGVCFPLDAIPPLGQLPPLGSLCQGLQDTVQQCITALDTKFDYQACLGALLRELGSVTEDVLCGLVPQVCRRGGLLNQVEDLLGGLLGGKGGGPRNGGGGSGGLDLGGLLDGLLGGQNGGGKKGGGHSDGLLGGLLGNLGGLGALGRPAAFGDAERDERNGRWMGELMSEHDPDLVTLLMSPMVVGR